MKSYALRPLDLNDIDAISRIEHESFSDPWSKASFMVEIAAQGLGRINQSLGVEDTETSKLVGYSFFWVIPDEEVHLNNVAVSSEHRRCGLAKMMLDTIVQQGIANQCEAVYLEVREKNHPAVTFYLRHGFDEIGRRKRYYSNPIEDAILLRLRLPQISTQR